MSIHGPSSLRSRETSTRTLLDGCRRRRAGRRTAPRRSCPSGCAHSRARISASRGRSSIAAPVDLERARGRGRGSVSWSSGRAGARARGSTACTTKASSAADRLGDRVRAGGQHSSPPPGGSARRPSRPSSAGRRVIARPVGVTSARGAGRAQLLAVAGAQARVASPAARAAATPRRRCAVAVATARLCGVDGREVAREVDDAEQRARVGVVDRRGRARPALDRLVEVLGPKTWTAWSAASAVPIAFVPAPGSLHSVPSAKFMTRRRACGRAPAPSMLSSMPSRR